MSVMQSDRGTAIIPSPEGRTPRVPAGGKSERGVALIIALVMLVLLTILGAWVLNSASTDIHISGNYRNNQQAFYAGDAAINYLTNANTLTTAYSSMSVTNYSYPVPPLTVSIVSQASGTVEFLRSGPLPLGTAYDADVDYNGNPKFHGLYFNVQSSGTGMNNAQVVVEAGVVQVVGN
jgi:type IV pilus assembly PilX-like protein